jgi:AraC-like DNA-binding protein
MNPYIKILYVINCIAAVHGIILSFILRAKKRNHKANQILALLVFLFSIGMAVPIFVSYRLYLYFPFLAPFFSSLPFIFAPLFYLYIKALTQRHFHFAKTDLWHGLPFVINFLYYSSVYFMAAAEQMVFLEKIYFKQSTSSYLSIALSLLQTFIYIVLCLRLLQSHTRKIKESFSALERINLSWVRHLVFMFVMIWFIVLGVQAFLPEPLLEEKLDDTVTYFLIALIIFTIGYRGLSQPEIFAEKTGKGKKYEKTGLSPQKGKSIKQRLLKLMEERRPYLDPGLTLAQVAEMMGVPVHQLSQVINESMEQNFYQFVNSYRLEEAKRRLDHPDTGNDKLIKIAFDSGFNSLPTFNRVFKDLTGESPSQYRERINISTG